MDFDLASEERCTEMFEQNFLDHFEMLIDGIGLKHY